MASPMWFSEGTLSPLRSWELLSLGGWRVPELLTWNAASSLLPRFPEWRTEPASKSSTGVQPEV